MSNFQSKEMKCYKPGWRLLRLHPLAMVSTKCAENSELEMPREGGKERGGVCEQNQLHLYSQII